MKAVLRSIMVIIILATMSVTAFAENIGDTLSSLSAGQAVSGVALLILVLVLPTFKNSPKY